MAVAGSDRFIGHVLTLPQGVLPAGHPALT